MKRICVLLVAVLFCLSGCSKQTEITGEAFVVTKGAGTYKLGLVQISVFSEKDILAFIERKKDDAEVARLKQEWESAKLSAEQARKQSSQVGNEYDQQKAVFDRTMNSDSETFLRDGKHSLDTVQWAGDQYKNALQSEKAATEKAADALAALNRVAAEQYFTGLPGALSTATTDSEGKFTIKLPKPGRYAFVANATRSVGSDDERYYWMIWVNADGEPQKVTLSNNNLADAGSSDSVITTTVYK